MTDILRAVKGMNDILPPESARWEWFEDKIRALMRRYAYRNVRSRRPSMKTGATGSSKVPGSEMPMSACFDSPGPLTTQPMTATRISSTPGYDAAHTGIC